MVQLHEPPTRTPLHQWCDLLVGKPPIGPLAQSSDLIGREIVAGECPQDPGSNRYVGFIGLSWCNLRIVLRHIKTAIGRQSSEAGIQETDGFSPSPCRDVSHWLLLSRNRPWAM